MWVDRKVCLQATVNRLKYYGLTKKVDIFGLKIIVLTSLFGLFVILQLEEHNIIILLKQHLQKGFLKM